ncbi:MAG: hypothetical protein SFV19_04680 [Rhodospirillaceae bacterium]|nr:hypothetical protein [Rhodospirillaceae bacterium]
MKISIEWSKATRPLILLLLLTALAVGLSSCGSMPSTCVDPTPGVRILSGHNWFLFRKTWGDFRSDLASFREAVLQEDSTKLNAVALELSKSLQAMQTYAPTAQGEACSALVAAKIKFRLAETKLVQLSATPNWPAANGLASELTATSNVLRETLPSSWFTRHRHGRHFH